MNKTSKNNILIIGVSDISLYILESLLNCNKNYNMWCLNREEIYVFFLSQDYHYSYFYLYT